MPDIDLASVVVDRNNQPVFVSTNVEHDEVAHQVRRRKRRTESLDIGEVLSAHDGEPTE